MNHMKNDGLRLVGPGDWPLFLPMCAKFLPICAYFDANFHPISMPICAFFSPNYHQIGIAYLGKG